MWPCTRLEFVLLTTALWFDGSAYVQVWGWGSLMVGIVLGLVVQTLLKEQLRRHLLPSLLVIAALGGSAVLIAPPHNAVVETTVLALAVALWVAFLGGRGSGVRRLIHHRFQAVHTMVRPIMADPGVAGR